MKRYLSFMGDNYYPSAAMGDFVGDFDSFDDAVNSLTNSTELVYSSFEDGKIEKSFSEKETWDYFDKWGCVYDCEKMAYVWSEQDL